MSNVSWTSLPQDAFDWIKYGLMSYVATMYEIIYNTFEDIYSSLKSDHTFSKIVSLFSTTMVSLWKASQKALNSVFGGIAFPTTVFGLFGLAIAFYLVYQTAKFLRWICFGSRRSSFEPDMRRSGNGVVCGRNNAAAVESRRWFKQAMNDLEAARNDFESDCPAPEWVCYKCYQSMEKLLKAYVISRHIKTEEMTLKLDDLASLTGDDQLKRIVQQLLRILGSACTTMCYPDSVPSPMIPRDMYSLKTAVMVHELTEQALEHTGHLLGFQL